MQHRPDKFSSGVVDCSRVVYLKLLFAFFFLFFFLSVIFVMHLESHLLFFLFLFPLCLKWQFLLIIAGDRVAGIMMFPDLIV